MAALIGLFSVFVIIQAVLLGVSVGIGFLLRWLIPGVDLGAGILAGLISTITTIFFFVQATKITPDVRYLVRPSDEDDEEDDCDEDEEEDYEEDESPPVRQRRFSPPPMIGRHWKKRSR